MVYKVNNGLLRFNEIKRMTKDAAGYLSPHKSIALYFSSLSLTSKCLPTIGIRFLINTQMCKTKILKETGISGNWNFKKLEPLLTPIISQISRYFKRVWEYIYIYIYIYIYTYKCIAVKRREILI